jgi:acyl carrier protein
MSVDDVASVVIGYIRERFMIGRPSDYLDVSDSLLEKGILDSTGVLELVGFLEEQYAIKVEDEELIPENLETVRKITDYVRRKKVAIV